jgi:hypothetical protein
VKIRMTEQITGTRNSVRWPAPGEEIDLPDGEAMDLCTNGSAVPVPEERIEKAVTPEPEKRGPGRPRKNTEGD